MWFLCSWAANLFCNIHVDSSIPLLTKYEIQAINLSYDRYTVYSPAGSKMVGHPKDSFVMMRLMEDDITELI